MTNSVVASAPGKVVLSGEYAVLDGAPAICMAVDRRARAALTEISGNICEVRAPGYTATSGRFESSDDGIRWYDGQAVFGIVDSVWRASKVQLHHGQLIDLDTSEFIDSESGRKTGIGSSAALTVALCAAVEGSADAATIMAIAQRAHADFQAGSGSGADIACSLSGGLIDYRMEGSAATNLNWPEGLMYRLIWSGIPASTKDQLSKLDAGVSLPSRVRLAGASERMAGIWHDGDADQVIEGYREYNEYLHQFSMDHELGIFEAGHEELWRAASASDLIYKPCGAGGGDIGIVLGKDEAILDNFTSKLAAKHAVLDCKLSGVGAVIETSEAEIV